MSPPSAPQHPTVESLNEALAVARVRIHGHAGDVRVLSVDEAGRVRVGWDGACVNCPAKAATPAAAILPVLEAIDGVTEVSAEGVNLPLSALRRLQAFFFPSRNSAPMRASEHAGKELK